MDFRKRIQALRVRVTKCIESKDSADQRPLEELTAYIKTMSAEVNADLEIAFREVLSDLLRECNNNVTVGSSVHRLFCVSLEISPKLLATFTHLGADQHGHYNHTTAF
jgi:hypothetical protein